MENQRLRAVLAVGAIVVIIVALGFMTQALALGGTGHIKQSVCHPVNGKGETGYGWDIIPPDKASSHIDEAEYPDGTYWKHTSSDGRHDVYADANGDCPGKPIPSESPSPSGTINPQCPTCPTDTVTPTPTQFSESPTPTGSPTPPLPTPTQSSPTVPVPPPTNGTGTPTAPPTETSTPTPTPPTDTTTPTPPPNGQKHRVSEECVGNALVTRHEKFVDGEWQTTSTSTINGAKQCATPPPGEPPVIEEGM